MRFWRVLGWLFILLSVVVLGMDLLSSLEAGTARMVSIAGYWRQMAPESFANAFGERATGIAGLLLGIPAFAPFLLLGLILLFTHPRRRKGIFTR